MSQEQDRVINITGGGCVPDQSFRLMDPAAELLAEDKQRMNPDQALPLDDTIEPKIISALQTIEPKKSSG